MITAMKVRTTLCLGVGTLLLNACQVWQPPGPPAPQPRNGASLDTPPLEGTRYMDNASTTTGPNYPNGPQDPSQIQAPQTNPTPDLAANQPAPTTDPTTPPPPTVTPQPQSTPNLVPAPAPTPPKPSAPAELPFGIKVPNKPGFVYSPYDKTAGIVDVTGFAPRTKVKCPYTNKVFLVP